MALDYPSSVVGVHAAIHIIKADCYLEGFSQLMVGGRYEV